MSNVHQLQGIFPHVKVSKHYHQLPQPNMTVKCGVEIIDVDAAIILRSLSRILRSGEHGPKAEHDDSESAPNDQQQTRLQFEAEVVKHAIVRIVTKVKEMVTPQTSKKSHRSFMSATKGGTLTGVKSLAALDIAADEDSGSDIDFEIPEHLQPRQKAGPAENYRDPGGRAARIKAARGLWGTVVRCAQRNKNDLMFLPTQKDLESRQHTLLKEAQAFGLGMLANTMLSSRLPRLKVSRVPPSEGSPGIVYSVCKGAPDPFASKKILVSASHTWGKSELRSLLMDTAASFSTGNHENSHVTFDFQDALVLPTAYAFTSRHHIVAGYFPRNWVLLGSLDGILWVKLKEHIDDMAFTKRSMTGYWEIPKPESKTALSPTGSKDPLFDGAQMYYRYLKVQTTGKNSFGSYEMQLSAFEVYGTVLTVETPADDEPLYCGIDERPTFEAPSALPPPPPIPKAGKGKKKK